MDRSMWTARGTRWTVAVIAMLVLAIVAGRLILGGRDFKLKPATGSAQAMAVAADRELAR
jgi:hypothetical protein